MTVATTMNATDRYEALYEAVEELAVYAATLRDASTDPVTGAVDEDDLVEVERVEGLVERARAALQSTPEGQ